MRAGFAVEEAIEDPDSEQPLEEAPYDNTYEYDPSQDVAAIATFPFCVCDDYRCSTSPYRIRQQRPQVGSVNTRLCYAFEYVSRQAVT
jgi:hypothetical protein